MSAPLILVTNDDGTFAPGIRALVEAVKPLGDVVVVAPDKAQSGMGHAITIHHPLYLKRLRDFGDIEAWSCSGTPVDCVKIARDKILDRKPDLCVSGINHGSNSSINIIYSGTMSAAMEAAIEGIPAIGFSLCDYNAQADMSAATSVARRIAKRAIEQGIPTGDLLNVNIPALTEREIKGIRICRQARAKWVEEFDERTTPHGRRYYWLTGRFESSDEGDDADESALADGFVSVVPVHYDFTDHAAIQRLRKDWHFEDEG